MENPDTDWHGLSESEHASRVNYRRVASEKDGRERSKDCDCAEQFSLFLALRGG